MRTHSHPVFHNRSIFNQSSNSTMDIPKQNYKTIEQLIGSNESVVGIDAKKTHIIIIHMLQDIHDNLNRLEKRIEEIESTLRD